MMVVADDTVVARSLGIKINQILSICWCIAAIAAAMGGILLTNVIGVSYFYIELGFKSMAVALVGGLQSLWGLVIVGPLMGIIEYMAIGYINPLVGGDAEIVGPWIVLLLVLLVRPFGFFGWRKIERV
jgi:branched-chain amino acid transport system permease protein